MSLRSSKVIKSKRIKVRVVDFVKSRPVVRTIRVLVCAIWLLSIYCQAATSIIFIESGTDATGDFAFFSSTSGTVASDATVSKTGPRSIKLSTGSPATAASVFRNGVLSDAGRRISCWFQFNTVSAVNNARTVAIGTSGGTNICQVGQNTNGTLRITPTGATAVVGTTVLSVNTWYRLTFSYVISSATSWKFILYINGVKEVTADSNGTLTTTVSDRLTLTVSNGVGANADIWYDNIYVDDGSDYTDPGDIRITAKRPAANNTNNYDTAIGNNPTNRWENVNEVPISITNGWEQLAIADTQENYGLQGASVGDVDISAYPLLGRTAWIWAKETASLGTPKIMDNGTETGITLTTSPALYTVTTTSAAYPSNAAGIGMRSAVTAAGTFLYDCGTVIAFVAPHPRNGDFNIGF